MMTKIIPRNQQNGDDEYLPQVLDLKKWKEIKLIIEVGINVMVMRKINKKSKDQQNGVKENK